MSKGYWCNVTQLVDNLMTDELVLVS